jgi:hypothetical protein
MIKLKSLLKENTSFDFAQASDVKFTPSSVEGNILLIPATIKDATKVDEIKDKMGDSEFLSALQIRIEKKLGLKVIADKRHTGAGYQFEIDMDELFKKL